VPFAAAAGPFAFSGLTVTPTQAWIGEKDKKDGDLRFFDLPAGAGTVKEGKPIASNPGGLGAVELTAQ